MSLSWMSKILQFVSLRPSPEPLNEGKHFTKCATPMIYAGELKLLPELARDSTSAGCPASSKAK